jgi:hypothetical protein
MIHILSDSWKLKGADSNLFIDCKEVYSYIRMKKFDPKEIDSYEIAHKPIVDICRNSIRYINADINMPGIVAKNMENPFMKEYRMIDGRHRLLKTIDLGKRNFNSYVLDREEILKFVRIL